MTGLESLGFEHRCLVLSL